MEGLKSSIGIDQLDPSSQRAISARFTGDTFQSWHYDRNSGEVDGFKPDDVFDEIVYDVSFNQAVEETRFPYEGWLRDLPEIKILTEEQYQEYKREALGTDQRVACDTAFVWNFARIFTKNKAKWTAMMRRMGFIGAVDENTGTIHPNEPNQAVFFDPASIQVLEVIHNKPPKQHKILPSGGAEHSLLSEWSENTEKGIGGALRFLSQSVYDLYQVANDRNNYLKPKDIIYDITRYIGWLNMHAKNNPRWSSDVRKEIIADINRAYVGDVAKEFKGQLDRILDTLRR
jgi:hypothetical protein